MKHANPHVLTIPHLLDRGSEVAQRSVWMQAQIATLYFWHKLELHGTTLPRSHDSSDNAKEKRRRETTGGCNNRLRQPCFIVNSVNLNCAGS